MKVTLAKADAVGAKADLLAVPVFAGAELGPGAEEAVAALGVPVAPLLEARGFTGKAGEAAALATLGRLPATVLLLVGVGERAKVDAEVLRRAAAAVVRQGRGARKAVTTLTQALPADPAAAVQAVAEGALLAAYRFDKYKQAKANGAGPAELATLALAPGPAAGRGSGGRSGLAGALAAGQLRAAATNLARDLSNEPANALHPADLAAAARKLLAGKGVTVKVKNEKELAAEGFGGIVGVGQGAEHPPRLIELRYAPKGAVGRGGPGRQGHHLRLGRPVAQAGRLDEDDEDRHVGGGGGPGHHERPGRPGRQGAPSPATWPRPRTCPRAGRPAPATCSP